MKQEPLSTIRRAGERHSSQGDENKSYSVELESVGAVRYTKTEKVCDSTSGMSSTTTLNLGNDSTVQTTISQECASSSQGGVKDTSPTVMLNSVGAVRQATTEGVGDRTSGMSTIASLIDLLPHLQPMYQRKLKCEDHTPFWWTIWMCLCIFVKGLLSSAGAFSVSEWSGWQSMVSAQLTPFIMHRLAMTLQDDGRLQRRRRKRQMQRRRRQKREEESERKKEEREDDRRGVRKEEREEDRRGVRKEERRQGRRQKWSTERRNGSRKTEERTRGRREEKTKQQRK